MTAIDERAGAVAGGPEDAPRPRPRRRPPTVPAWLESRWAVVRDVGSRRLWPSIVLFFVLASVATTTSSGGAYVGDNRFEQYWNPARRIAKTLTIWDGSRGFGRVREDFWPGPTLPIAVLRGLGISAPLTEHLFHAMLITAAGIGMVAIVRLFRPRIGVEHLIAGLFVSFGAYSATFLIPSNLYYAYAMAPWLFYVFFRGVHSSRPWRWAAIFALLVFSPGNVDTPGLVYNVVPLIGVGIYVVLIERSVRLRDVIAWLARAGVLSVFASTAVLVKTWLASAALGQRLSDTESVDVSAITSSWSESMRGLGNWLSYFREGPDLLKPQGEAYFTNWFVVAATFVPPCVALWVLWRSRWRVRILYAITILLSAVVLVGGFPQGGSSPLGKAILDAYTSVPMLGAFRNTYKIGAGLVIGIAGLFAYGVVLASRSLARRGDVVRHAPVALAAVTLLGISFPFWTGNLYHPDHRMGELPEYWTDAFDHLAELPDDGRSLVLPQTSRARYRWGWVGDDIFDALDARNHAIATGVPLSTPVAANVLEALSVVASDPHYVPGTLAPLMRRVGLTEIVLRNDLDWQALDRPRPSAYDGVRNDPDFRRSATFGRPGENTADPQDASEGGKRDRSYPPVEVLTLSDPVGGLHTVAPVVPVVVSGDGFAWAPMAQAGLLGGPNPIAYSGDLDVVALRDELTRGAPVVVTDTNRRRLRVVLSYEADYSYTLGPDQQLDRPAQQLWREAGSQSVAWFPDATSVALSGPARSVGGTQAWNRPTNAVDGDLGTAWTLRRLDGPLDRVLRIDLRSPREVSEARITPLADAPASGGITRGELKFSDGSSEPVTIAARGTTNVSFTARRTDWIEFVPKALGSEAQTVGLAELEFPGIDLTEHIQAPDDLFRRAETDAALAAAVRRAPTAYVFDRSVSATTETNPLPGETGAESNDEETSIRRRFRTLGDHTVEVSGTFRLRPDTPDRLIDQLVGGDHGAYAEERHRGAVSGYGGFAVDGDPATSWLAPAEEGQTVTLRFPRQEVRTVDLSSAYDGTSSKLDRFEVDVPDPEDPERTITVTGQPGSDGTMAPSDPACDGGPANAPPACRRAGMLTLPEPVTTDRLTVRLTGFSGRTGALGGRLRVDEIRINGATNGSLFRASAAPATCLDLGMRVTSDGATTPVRVSVGGELPDLLRGRSAPVTGCDPITLGDGWHQLDSGDHAPLDQVQLVEPSVRERTGPATEAGPTFTVVERGPTDVRLRIEDASRGSVVLFNESFDGGWRAFVDGRPLGRSRDLNAMNGWVLDTDGTVEVELRYNPRSFYGWSLPVSAIGVLFCAYLALRRPRRRRDPDEVLDG